MEKKMEERRTATLLAIAAEALRGLSGRRFEPARGPSKRRASGLLLLVVALYQPTELMTVQPIAGL